MRSFLIIFLFQAGIFTASAQKGEIFHGRWEGKIAVGGNGLTFVINVTDNGRGGLTATADSPDQGVFGIKCDSAWFAGTEITVELKSLNASYKGRLSGDTTLVGTFSQGMEIPLNLTKTSAAPAAKRPQEPRPPFPYKSEEIVYHDPKGARQYGATITIPQGKGPFPAALLITGSGPQNRDEEVFGHKAFAVLADALTRNGFVVLRVDDRGIGKTTGPFSGATTADFADDARTGLQYLQSRPEVNKKKTGMIGHSEGGMIAPMVAANRDDIDFIVLLAGPGVPVSQLMADQNAAIFRQAGMSEPAITSYIDIYTNVAKHIVSTTDSLTALNKSIELIRSWRLKTDTALLRELRVNGDETDREMATAFASAMRDNWFRYFYSFDPTGYLQNLRCKVLALNGSKDIQVLSSANLPAIEASLKKSKSRSFIVKEMPGLNHLFQTCKTCSTTEYGQLEETFAPAALEEINNWLNKNVK
ncbi:alpha/beta hydrolase [Terrimonas sp. NA20]|uniref:Alpha/beta hydrolase n=1 Tax=Terrimonas ginsenosidimutans TaxID=2908004 RepID=A0ABS9KZX1_9BACT|nr:alpha/beta fold hydrolase [Terrimonas ginsenosidimutans]MCG2617924.1 alpha/beta hydrolase [Terrimonas ginsenosidimutans]